MLILHFPHCHDQAHNLALTLDRNKTNSPSVPMILNNVGVHSCAPGNLFQRLRVQGKYRTSGERSIPIFTLRETTVGEVGREQKINRSRRSDDKRRLVPEPETHTEWQRLGALQARGPRVGAAGAVHE